MLKNLFGNKKDTPINPNPYATMEVLFYKDVNGLVEHGSIWGSHTQHNLNDEGIRFHIVDIDPPMMNSVLMAHIEERARHFGYFGNGQGGNITLRSYVNLFPVHPRPATSLSTPVPNQQRTGQSRSHRNHRPNREASPTPA